MYPLYLSVGIMTAYSFLYSYVGITGPDGTKLYNQPCLLECQISQKSFSIWLDSMYVSIATFSSVGTNSYSFNSLLPRIIAGSEALIGALLIALFVFTLGRQMGR